MGRLALLIANDSFLDQNLHPLVAPHADARSLRKLLLDEEIGGFDSAAMLVNESKPEIERSIERVLGQAGPEDLVCLYFSGHGLRDGQGDLYFAVANTEQDLLRSTAVSASFLLNLMEHSQAASVVLLLDCCFSGALIKGFKGSTELRDVLAVGRGRFILTASNQIELARDGRIGADGSAGHSAFTGVIVEGLRTGKADVDNDGRITPENLWTYVSREMRDTAPRQTPKKFGEVSQEAHLARVRTGLHTALDSGMRVHLGDLLGRRSQTADQGYRAEDFPGLGKLIVPIGQVIDAGQRKNRVLLNLGRDHLLIVGRIGCGKSTLLRTLACGLSLTHTPDEARLVFLESGGAKLGSLRRLPHVASYVTNRDTEKVTGLLGRLEDVIGQRNDLFVRHYTANVAEFRDARERWDSAHVDYPHPTVFVFVDRWADFAATVPGFADRMAALASAGLDVGVHVVISARSWGEVPRPVEELVSRRIEFGLAEAGTTRFDGEVAATLAAEPAGWAQTKANRLRVALPSLEPVAEVTSSLDGALSDGAPQLVEHVLRSNADSGAVAWREWGVLRTGEPVQVATAVSDDARDGPADGTVPAAAPSPAGEADGTRPAADAVPVAVESTDSEPPADESTTTTAESGRAATAAAEPDTGSPYHGYEWAAAYDQAVATPNPLTVSPRLERLLGLPNDFHAGDLEILRRNDDGTIPFGSDAYGNLALLPFGFDGEQTAKPVSLIVGADFSGKNELVRTILFCAVARHPVERLNLALFSYRSRDIFESMDQLPHSVATARRLIDSPAHAHRYAKLLNVELDTRANLVAEFPDQQVSAGSANSPSLSRLPTLLVVIDKFTDLTTSEPEFGVAIERICRTGHQIGVQLLLSARSLQTEDVAFLDPHLRSRIAMRCDVASSRAVIGNPNAAELPDSPGSGFLRADGHPPIRFSSATTFHLMSNNKALAHQIIEVAGELDRPSEDRWPEPMTGQPELSDLLPVEMDVVRGIGAGTAEQRSLKVPIGLIEHDRDLRPEPLTVDFTGQSTHAGGLLITGAPDSGKSQVAVAATVALSLTHTPDDLHTYIISPHQHSGLEQLLRLPHVGGFATAENPQKVRRTIHELFTLLRRRQSLISNGRVSTFDEYFRLRAFGSKTDRYARVLLVIRGWAQFTELFPDITAMAIDLVCQGTQYGIHAIVTSSDDATERLLLMAPKALRHLVTIDHTGFDGERTRPDITASGNCHGVDETGAEFTGAHAEPLVEQIARAWNRDRAPAIPRLPAEIRVNGLPTSSDTYGLSIPIGVDMDTLGPAFVNFTHTPHLLIYGNQDRHRDRFLVALTESLARQPRQNRTVTVFTRDSKLTGSLKTLPGVRTRYIPRSIDAAPWLKEIQTRLSLLDGHPASSPLQTQAGSVQEFVIVDCFDAPGSLPKLVSALWTMMEVTTPGQLHLVLSSIFDHAIPGGIPISEARPAVLRLTHNRQLDTSSATLTEPRGERKVLLARPTDDAYSTTH